MNVRIAILAFMLAALALGAGRRFNEIDNHIAQLMLRLDVLSQHIEKIKS